MSIPNDTRLQDAINRFRGYGRKKAQGGDAWPMALLDAVEQAREGVFTPDMTELLLSEYIDAGNMKAIHDRTIASAKKSKSELKRAIDMGALTTIDAVDVMGRAVTIFRDMTEEKKSTVNAYMQVIRDQLKAPDYALTDADIKQAMTKDDAKARSIQARLKAALKEVEKAIAENDEADDKIDLDYAATAKAALEKQIATLTHAAEVAEARARLRALGVAA